MAEKVTAVVVQVELSEFNENGELESRKVVPVEAVEAKIPAEVREWLLKRALGR